VTAGRQMGDERRVEFAPIAMEKGLRFRYSRRRSHGSRRRARSRKLLSRNVGPGLGLRPRAFDLAKTKDQRPKTKGQRRNAERKNQNQTEKPTITAYWTQSTAEIVETAKRTGARVARTDYPCPQSRTSGRCFARPTGGQENRVSSLKSERTSD